MPDTEVATIAQARTWGRMALSRLQDDAAFEADVLLAATLNTTRATLIAHPQASLKEAEQRLYQDRIARRANNEPTAYILGEREFRGRVFEVSPDVLIPRPETELLVEAALQRIRRTMTRVVDLGTGSGAIAISLAVERPWLQVVAVDISSSALAIARGNAQRHRASHVHFVCANWCDSLMANSVDMIVANPPYVARGDTVDAATAFEPKLALFAGNRGLAAVATIVADADRVLRHGGCLLLEHGNSQGAAVRALLHDAHFVGIDTVYDYAGHERVTLGHSP